MKIRILPLLVALVFLLSACQTTDKLPETAKELLALGEKHLLEKDYEQALTCFTKVIETETENPRGYTGSAEAYIGLGQENEAIEMLQLGARRVESPQIERMLVELGVSEESPSPTATAAPSETPEGNTPEGDTPEPTSASDQGSAYFYDDAEWFAETATVEAGMKYFYDKTGVMPYIYLTDTMYSESKADDLMNSLFDEQLNENYYVVLLMENESTYALQSMTGLDAEKIIDVNADNIILDCLEELYASDMSNEEFIAEAFRRSADKIAK